MNAFGEPIFECAVHPSQIIVGICSSCLRERLIDLIRRTDEEKRREIMYTPDPSSWGYLTGEKKLKDYEIYRAPAIGNPDLHYIAKSARSAVSHRVEPSEKVEWPTRTKARDNNYSEGKKGRKKCSGLRSFFLRLEGVMGFKKDSKGAGKAVCEHGIEGELHDRYESPQGSFVECDRNVRRERSISWIASVVDSKGCKASGANPRHGNSSARRSFSERRSGGGVLSWDGFALERSMSNIFEEETPRRQETGAKKPCRKLENGPRRCSDGERDGKYFSDFFSSIRCRNQAQVDVSHAQFRARDCVGRDSSHGFMGENTQKEGRNLQHSGANDMLPNSKIRGSLNSNQRRPQTDSGQRGQTGKTDNGWVRTLSGPKRSFHENRNHSARHEIMAEILSSYKIALSP